MAVSEVPTPGVDQAVAAAPRRPQSPWLRLSVFTGRRMFSIFVSLVIAVYITITVVNMGGHMDEIKINQIREGIAMVVPTLEEFKHLNATERRLLIEDLVQVEVERLNLHTPFWIRSFGYLGNALTLQLGKAEGMASDSGSQWVQDILVERLAPTLFMQVSSFLLIFFTALLVGLSLSRRYGSFLDKLAVALAPSSSAPPWFYGIFMILLFAAVLGWLPFGGLVDAPPPDNTWDYFVSVMRHLILPVGSIFVSSIFFGIFSQRTFFLIFSSEDYVDVAKAKGLSDRAIERRYVLRPTLPTILTNFLLSIIGLWGGAAITEQVFNYPGLGRLLLQAADRHDTPVIVASTIVFGYLLAITVLVLDFVYALVDPRIQVGAEESAS